MYESAAIPRGVVHTMLCPLYGTLKSTFADWLRVASSKAVSMAVFTKLLRPVMECDGLVYGFRELLVIETPNPRIYHCCCGVLYSQGPC